MITVTSLSNPSLCAKINGSLEGLNQESYHFQKSIVDKIPLMQERFENKPEMFETFKSNINNREMAFRSTISSLSDFEKVSENIKRDLETIETNLIALGEISVFLPGINKQLQMLNTTENTLARVEAAIESAKVNFSVGVKKEYETQIEDKKADLNAKYLSFNERQQYQLVRAKENKQRIEAYLVRFESVVNERSQVTSQVQFFIENDKTDTKEADQLVKVRLKKKH